MSDNGKPSSDGYLRPELAHACRKDFLYSWALLQKVPFRILMKLWNASSRAEEDSIVAEIKAGKHTWDSDIL
ncbi:MAG: hypothetical protein HUU49_02205 [Candidatus Buchananbacteria bacterium]|nr:hypothetical protein [Candidatus Buchananbacteria bacterium]